MVRPGTLKWMGLALFAVSISSFLTSYFIIGYVQLSAVFAGWLLLSIVLLLVSTAGGYAANPVSLIQSYRHLVRQVLEEVGLHDINPLFLPSRISGFPSMYLSLDSGEPPENLPRRFFIFGGGLGVRLETLGSYLISELGGVGEGLSSAEAFLRSSLQSYLELVRGVEVTEAGDDILVKVSGFNREVVDNDPPPVNIYVQVTGPVLAESLDRPVHLRELSQSGKHLLLSFTTV